MAGVEHALKNLWDGDQALTKATLVNLVILSTRSWALETNTALVSGITRSHACRVLLIDACPGSACRAWITAHCHLSGGKKSICSEQMAFMLDSDRDGLVRGILLAHLLGDLPVICWWQGALDHNFEPGLFSHIDRLLIDSSAWESDGIRPQMESLLAARATMAGPFSIHDLAWTRTFQFRIAIAALFDHPHAMAMLPDIHAGEVVVAPGHRAAAVLLAAWLATIMRWQATGGAAGHWTFTSPDGQARRVDWREEVGSPPLGRIMLTAPSGRIEAVRPAGATHIRATIMDGSGQPSLVFPADPDNAGELVAAMLSRGGKNSLYSAVLPAFMAMLAVPDK